MNRPNTLQQATRAVHGGRESRRSGFAPTIPAVHRSVTYHYPSMDALDEVLAGERDGYVYTRHGNPTVRAFEDAVAGLEGAEAALAFASGMAAIYAALLATGARQGTAVLAARDLYGATHSLLSELMASQGVTVRFVNAADAAAVEAACAEFKPVAVLVETMSNPLLQVANLPVLAEAARRHGAALLVDSTFATPVLLQPLSLGADMVIHSATKYLAGHGDVLGGVIATSKHLRQSALQVLKLTGGNLAPDEAWLALRGMRTLVLRLERHSENAMRVATWLEAHHRVQRVYYPGLASHPQHELARKLFAGRGYGGMVSFEIARAGRDEVFGFLEALQLCVPATTLGDVHTLLLYPAHSSHRTVSEEERERMGISEGLVRISVGIEAVDDVIGDLERALSTL